MKLLINTSNIKKSGALQVTLSFLEEIKQNNKHQFAIILSESVKNQIDETSFNDNFIFYNLSLITPFKRGYFKFLESISNIEKEFLPDCVFSVFSPTYWTPKTIHVAGFAYPWVINPDSDFIKSLPIKKIFLQFLENKFKSYFIKRNSKYFIVETDDVQKRLHKYVGISIKNIFVVSSTYSHYFNIDNPFKTEILINKKNPQDFRILTIALNFPHKNLSIIKDISDYLKNKKVNGIYFYVTLPDTDFYKLFHSVTDYVINIGTFQASSGPSIYSQCDVLFMPTLLECFSATYPEAMISGKPIITSDLDFARSVCQDAAIYVNPYNPDLIAEAILDLRSNKKMYDLQVDKGFQRVKDFPNAQNRAEEYLRICEEIVFSNL